MADVKFAVVRQALPNTPSGTVDFTSSGFGTPKAVIFLANNTRTANNPDTHCYGSIGFYDGTNQYCSSFSNNDSDGVSSLAYRYQQNDHAVNINLGSTIYAEYTATFSGVTDGVRLTCTYDATSFARHCIAILIGGSDVSADCGDLQLGTNQNDTAAVSSLSYTPDILFVGGAGVGANAGAVHSLQQLGVATYDSPTITQRLMMTGSRYNISTSETSSVVETDRICGQILNDAITYTAELTIVASDGFTLTTRDGGSGSDYVNWLALNLGGGDKWLGTLTTKTSVTTDPITDPVFEPNGLIAAGVDNSAVDSHSTASCWASSIGASDGTTEYSSAFRDEDSVGTSDNDSECNARVIDIRNYQNGNDLTYATLDSFDTNGFTLNYGAAGGTAYKGWILAMGDASAAPASGHAGPLVGNEYLRSKLQGLVS